MNGKLTVATIAILLIGLARISFAQNHETERHVLLNNGQVVSGFVESSATETAVIKPSGSRILFSNQQVLAIENTLSEIYWIKCSSLSATDAKRHSDLYYWCVSRKLFNEAQNQIDLLQSMQIRPTRLLIMLENLETKTKAEQLRVEQERIRMEQERLRIEQEQYALRVLPKQPKSKTVPAIRPATEPANAIRQVSYEAVELAIPATSTDSSRSIKGEPKFFAADLAVGFEQQEITSQAMPVNSEAIVTAESIAQTAAAPGVEPAKANNLFNAAKIPKPDAATNDSKLSESPASAITTKPKVTGADPFDPDIFNRRFFGSDSPQS